MIFEQVFGVVADGLDIDPDRLLGIVRHLGRHLVRRLGVRRRLESTFVDSELLKCLGGIDEVGALKQLEDLLERLRVILVLGRLHLCA